MGRLVLVLLKVLRSAKRWALRRRRSGEVLDGGTETGRRRFICRWNGARRLASLVCALLAQSAFRSRLSVEAGAFSATREPRDHSRRRQPENVKVARERD